MPTIQKWGNSLAVRIPVAVADQIEVQEGSSVDLLVEHGVLVVRPRKRPQYRLTDLLRDCKPSQLHTEVDLGPDVCREVIE